MTDNDLITPPLELVQEWATANGTVYKDLSVFSQNTNFRKLCEELLDELQYQTNWSTAEDLQERARAALAEPDPGVPTDEELCDLMYEFTIGTGHGERLDEIGFARAVLARWGK